MRLLFSLILLGSSVLSGAEIPAGQTLELRLETYLASYSAKPGDPIRAVLTAPVVRDHQVLLPVGTHVYGEVVHAHRIGVGLVHERALLQINFDSLEQPSGSNRTRLLVKTRLVSVDNAREQVNSRGQIKGVLAAGGVPSLLHGTWVKPPLLLLSATSSGFQGLGPEAAQALSMAPISMAGFFAGRLLLVRWAEPEIHLAPGTDLRVQFEQPLTVEPVEAAIPASADPQLADLVRRLPVHPTKEKG